MRRALIGAGVLGLVVSAWLALLAGQSRSLSPQVALVDGRLAPCPRTSNCVNTEDLEAGGFSYAPAPVGVVEQTVVDVIERSGGVVVQRGNGHVVAEYRSAVFGFVDDLEVRIDPVSHAVQFRSASRVGRSDLGANRRRVRSLRDALAASALDPAEVR